MTALIDMTKKERQEALCQENLRILTLQNQRGDAEARLLIADEILKLRERIEQLECLTSDTFTGHP